MKGYFLFVSHLGFSCLFSPTESTLFETGWKDDCAFYGDPDSFMTVPFTQTERRLLVRTELFERGLAIPEHSAKIEDSEISVTSNMNVASENAFLPNPTPLSLLSLPNDLRNARSRKVNTYASVGDGGTVYEKSKSRREGVMQSLHATVFANMTWQPQLFFSVLHRTLDPLIPEWLQIDQRFYLDYLPFLRCLAVFDRAAERAFKKGIDIEESSSKKRTSTRSATRKGFSHVWEKIVPRKLFRENDENDNRLTATDLTNMLADLTMYNISSI